MKGTILDFLTLAAEKPELAQELVALAAKHDFEFTLPDEVTDAQLDKVAGGTLELERATSDPTKPLLDSREYTLLSNILKVRSDTAHAEESIDNVR